MILSFVLLGKASCVPAPGCERENTLIWTFWRGAHPLSLLARLHNYCICGLTLCCTLHVSTPRIGLEM